MSDDEKMKAGNFIIMEISEDLDFIAPEDLPAEIVFQISPKCETRQPHTITFPVKVWMEELELVGYKPPKWKFAGTVRRHKQKDSQRVEGTLCMKSGAMAILQ